MNLSPRPGFKSIYSASVFQGPEPYGVRGWCLVAKPWVNYRLHELGYDWCPQLRLYVRYDRAGTDYQIEQALAAVGSEKRRVIYQLR